MGEEERISLSFNTFSVDALGNEETLTHLDLRSLVNESKFKIIVNKEKNI
jgi:hypothetical protein